MQICLSVLQVGSNMDNILQQFKVIIKSLGPDIWQEFNRQEIRYSNFTKEVSFTRYIGMSEEESYQKELCLLNEALEERVREHRLGYLKVEGLHRQIPVEKAEIYIQMYENRENPQSIFPFRFENSMWERAFRQSYMEMLTLYAEASKHTEPVIIRNFGVKLLYWIDQYFPKLFIETKKMRSFPKLIFCGDIKLQEYIFLYFLVRMGCDVLYLNPQGDAQLGSKQLLEYSYFVDGGERRSGVKLAVFDENRRKQLLHKEAAKEPSRDHTKKPQIDVKDRIQVVIPKKPAKEKREIKKAGEPLDYVELAKKASSVVMIRVYNGNKECIKTGSGVIISHKGYILTNFHVACNGAYYGIQLEEEEHVSYTDELIKYNQDLDLAILRVDRVREPIGVYRGGQELVRGQKVVAIGSPLGLFNTVSDGIVSGFRKLSEVSMIQFTAPISPGSSGGALLNMSGELIGILTAGFDDGQNLNLAVDFHTICSFAGGFL